MIWDYESPLVGTIARGARSAGWYGHCCYDCQLFSDPVDVGSSCLDSWTVGY